MADVFISYSRQDKAFVLSLRDALVAASRSVWVDLYDIPPSANWQEEIYAAIDGADALVFVLTPESLASAACGSEVARALEAGKRIVPILHREVNPALIPRPLAVIQWIPWRTPADSNTALGLLLAALDTDLPYLKQGTRIFVRAREWESKDHNSSFALRGKELAEAERWLAGSGGKAPPPSYLQTQYIAASRRAAGARQRTLIGSLTTGIVVTLLLAILSSLLYGVTLSQKNDLQTQNTILRAQALAGRANDALLQNHQDQALLLSLAAVRQHDDFDTRNALLDALDYSPYLESILRGDTGALTSEGGIDLTFSKDGRTLMMAEDNHMVTLWDVATHTARLRFKVPTLPDQGVLSDLLLDAAMSPDGKLIATKSALSSVILFNAVTGAQIATIADPGIDDADLYHRTLLFSPDGRYLAWTSCADRLCHGEHITLWSVASQRVVRIIPLQLTSTGLVSVYLAFSPDGRSLAAAECDTNDFACPRNLLEVFSVATGASLGPTQVSLSTTPRQTLQVVAFSPDGRTLALGGCTEDDCNAGEVAFWNVATRAFTGTTLRDPTDNVVEMAYSGDGRYLVTAGGFGTVRIWDVAAGRLVVPQLPGHSSLLNSLAFSPDGQHFATAAIDGRVLLWRLAPYTAQSLMPGLYEDGTSQVAYNRDGTLMAVAVGSKITLWNTVTNRLVRTLSVPDSQNAFSLAFSPDGTRLASGDRNVHVLLWNVASGSVDGPPLAGHNPAATTTDFGFITDLAFSPDGRYLVSSGLDQQIVLTDLATRNVVHIFRIRDGNPHGAAFSPDGRWLAIAGDTGVILWDMHAGTIARTLVTTSQEVRAVAFSRAGVLASLDADGTLTIWNDLSAPGKTLHDSQVKATLLAAHLTFSPDGSLLVSSHDLAVTFWDLASGTKYVHTITPANQILDAALTPDGRYLAVITNGGPLEVSYATLPAWETQVCLIANRNLTQAEWQQFFPPDQPYQKICGNLPVPSGT